MDLNADIGHAGVFQSILLVLGCLVLGAYAIVLLSRFTSIKTKYGIAVFSWYLGIAFLTELTTGIIGSQSDEVVYDRQAATLARDWGYWPRDFDGYDLTSGKKGFSVLLGLIYSLGGRVPFAGAVVNCAIVACTFILVAYSSKRLYGQWNPWVLTLVFFTFPPFLTLGPGLFREPLCWLGIALISVGYSYRGDSRIASILWIVFGLALVLYVRTSLGYLVILGMLIGQATVVLRSRYGHAGLIAAVMTGLVALVLQADFLVGLAVGDSERVSIVRTSNTEEAITGFSVTVGRLSSLGDGGLILATIPHTLLGPFPWEIGFEPVWIWILASSLFWWTAIIALIRHALTSPMQDETLSFFVVSGVMLAGMGITLTNYGIVVRMRSFPFILLLVALAGLKRKAAVTKIRHVAAFTPNERASLDSPY